MKIIRVFYKKLNLIFRLLDPVIDIKKIMLSLPSYSKFFKDMIKFKRKDKLNLIKIRNIYPCIHDNTPSSNFDRHYIYHPAWAARILRKTNPNIHIDISSTLHFCTIVSGFIKMKFYDFRPAQINLSNLSSEHADLTHLQFESNSIMSLSCMHTVEHIGLGRYGDPIDPEGDIKAISELQRVLANNGNLLFVVPIGKSKIMFNAHRIYSYGQIINYFSNLELLEFCLVPDDKQLGFIENASVELADQQNYGCGCFWFRKN